MATKIRLARAGTKKHPYYRVVIADSRSPRDGRFIEKIGTYNPLLAKDDENRVNIKADRVEHWLSVGAIPSEKVLTFINAAKIGQKFTVVKDLTERRNNIIELKKEEIAARKKAEAEKAAAEAKAKEEEAKAAAEEAKAAEEAAAAEVSDEEASVEEAKEEQKTEEAPKEEEPKAEEAPAEETTAEEAKVEEAPAEEKSE